MEDIGPLGHPQHFLDECSHPQPAHIRTYWAFMEPLPPPPGPHVVRRYGSPPQRPPPPPNNNVVGTTACEACWLSALAGEWTPAHKQGGSSSLEAARAAGLRGLALPGGRGCLCARSCRSPGHCFRRRGDGAVPIWNGGMAVPQQKGPRGGPRQARHGPLGQQQAFPQPVPLAPAEADQRGRRGDAGGVGGRELAGHGAGLLSSILGLRPCLSACVRVEVCGLAHVGVVQRSAHSVHVGGGGSGGVEGNGSSRPVCAL